MRSNFMVALGYALFLVTFVAAWSGQPLFNRIEGLVQRRQDDSTTTTSEENTSQTQTGTISPSSDPMPTITSSSSPSSSSEDSNSGSASTTGTDSAAGTSGTKTTEKSTKTSSTSIDPALPPGGIEMITPAAVAAASQYFKIGDYVTLAWNYTSLSVTPSAIDVMASCSANDQLYTIALNQSVSPTGAVTWDTSGYQQTGTIPLLTETYTLVIYDAAESISAVPKAGYLGTSDQFTFGMYIPQAYTSLGEFKCATCASGALSDMERHALGFVFAMATITLLSFTWFVGGASTFF